MIENTNTHPAPKQPELVPQEHNTPMWRKVTVGVVAAGALLSTNELRHDRNEHQLETQISSQNTEANQKIDKMARLLAASNGVRAETVLGEGLKSVESLPGYEKSISPEKQSRFKKSVIKIGVRDPKLPESSWGGNCTGTKVTIGSETRVLTAAHCISTTGQEWSAFTGDPGLPGPNVLNVTDYLSSEYAVFGSSDFALPSNKTGHSEVESIVKDIDRTADFALLKVVPGNDEFDQLPAIDITQLENIAPLPGQEVALFGIPEASGNSPIETKGRYLGRVPSTSGLSTTVDLVGIMAPEPGEDACNYGASGSIAMFAEGGFTGPLTARSNQGYGKESRIYAPDSSEFGVKDRLKLEEQLNLDLSKFTTICSYSVSNEDTVSSLERELTNPTPLSKLPKQTSYK